MALKLRDYIIIFLMSMFVSLGWMLTPLAFYIHHILGWIYFATWLIVTLIMIKWVMEE